MNAVSSREKIEALIGTVSAEPPADPEAAQAAAAFTMVRPFVEKLIPRDPDSIDELLLKGARLALTLMSDWAQVPTSLTIAELLEEPEEIEGDVIGDSDFDPLEPAEGAPGSTLTTIEEPERE